MRQRRTSSSRTRQRVGDSTGNRLHAAGTNFIPPALRFCSPQPIDSSKLVVIEALDQEVRESCARFARQFQSLFSQPFYARRHDCTIRNLVACLKQLVAPPDNPNVSAFEPRRGSMSSPVALCHTASSAPTLVGPDEDGRSRPHGLLRLVEGADGPVDTQR